MGPQPGSSGPRIPYSRRMPASAGLPQPCPEQGQRQTHPESLVLALSSSGGWAWTWSLAVSLTSGLGQPGRPMQLPLRPCFSFPLVFVSRSFPPLPHSILWYLSTLPSGCVCWLLARSFSLSPPPLPVSSPLLGQGAIRRARQSTMAAAVRGPQHEVQG